MSMYAPEPQSEKECCECGHYNVGLLDPPCDKCFTCAVKHAWTPREADDGDDRPTEDDGESCPGCEEDMY